MSISQEWIWKGKTPPQQVVEINNIDIPQDPSLIELEVHAEPYGPIQVSTPSKEGTQRNKRFISQLATYAHRIIGERYEYALT